MAENEITAAKVISQLFFDNANQSGLYRSGCPQIFQSGRNYHEFKLSSLMQSQGIIYIAETNPKDPFIEKLATEIEIDVCKSGKEFDLFDRPMMEIDPYDDFLTIFPFLVDIVSQTSLPHDTKTALQKLMEEYTRYQIPEDEILDLSADWRASRDIVLGIRGELGNLVKHGLLENITIGPRNFPTCSLEIQVKPAVIELNEKGYSTEGSSGYNESLIRTPEGINIPIHNITLAEMLTPEQKAIVGNIPGAQYSDPYPFLYATSCPGRKLRDIQAIFNNVATTLPPK